MAMIFFFFFFDFSTTLFSFVMFKNLYELDFYIEIVSSFAFVIVGNLNSLISNTYQKYIVLLVSSLNNRSEPAYAH